MSRKLVAIQLAGYAAALALVYVWLGIADRSAWQLLLSTLVALAVIFGAVWLMGAALAPSFVPRRWPRFFLWVLAGAAIVAGALWMAGLRPAAAMGVASRLTLWSRRPIKPQLVSPVYTTLLWTATIAALVAVLPFASEAAEGKRHTAAAALRNWRYWVGCAALVAAGWYLPKLLIWWIPKFQGFAAQTASLLARFALAYAIAVAAWLALGALTRRCRSAASASR